MRHTTGPWKTIDTYVESVSGRLVASAIVIKGKSLRHDSELMAEARANAHLIAAAPELLEVAELTLDLWLNPHGDEYFDGVNLQLKLENAINKAKGK